jgi:hypothetical protein
LGRKSKFIKWRHKNGMCVPLDLLFWDAFSLWKEFLRISENISLLWIKMFVIRTTWQVAFDTVQSKLEY